MPSHPLPCSYSVPTQTSPTLNAITPITDDQERRARHLRQCARLAEIAMEEVEAAHEEALDDIRMHADRRISPISGQPTHLEGRDTTFAELVAILSRCVRQAILLEARLAAGAYDSPATQNQPPRQHPTENPATPAAPATVTTDRIHIERVEDESAPTDANRSVQNILAGICADLGTAIDAGLVAKSRPHPDMPITAPPPRDRPRRPPPLSQAERAKQAYLQQTTHSPGHPYKPP